MFGLFKKKKPDAKAGDKAAAKGKTKVKDAPATKAADAKALVPVDTKPAKKPQANAQAVPTSLKEAIAMMEGEVLPPEKPVSAGVNLDKAREALAKKAAAPMDRKALIEQALAIQQTKAKMLDSLPEATRNKLRDMAMKAFVVDEPKSTDQKKKMN